MLVYLDANIVIYLVERHPIWEPKATARISALQATGDIISVSDAHRLECLVGPFILNDTATLADYNTFFSASTVKVLPLTAAACEHAARLRATYNFKPLDALHLGAAIEHGCGLFLTNDVQLKKCPEIAVEILT